jgi:hypothetical protein
MTIPPFVIARLLFDFLGLKCKIKDLEANDYADFNWNLAR